MSTEVARSIVPRNERSSLNGPGCGQLPNFLKTAEQLRDPLDLWLYFLNNGKWLDPDNLPQPLRILEMEEAMDVLKKLTQDEHERELYEAREKARRDALSWEKTLEDWQQQVQQAEQQVQQAEQEVQRAQQQAAHNLAKGQLIGQIRLCEEMLKCPPFSAAQLEAMSVDELQRLAGQLRGQLPI